MDLWKMTRIITLFAVFLLFNLHKGDARNYLPPNVGQVYGIHGLSPVDCYEGSGPFNSTTFKTCKTEGRCVKLTVVTLGKITEEEHRCQGEEETEEFKTACAGPGTNTCQDISINGKEWNLCCCNDKPWCNHATNLYASLSIIFFLAAVNRMI